MRNRIICKFWKRATGTWYALVYRDGLIYSLPYNLAVST